MTKPPLVPPRHRWLIELRGLLVLALAVIAFHSVVAKPFYIPSESMMPGLLTGDRLVVSRYPYGWSYASASFHLLPPMPGRLFGRSPARGDVVIVAPQDAGHAGEDLIKRVVGLPGDTVQMIGGRLWLNGRPVPVHDMGERLMPIDGNFRCGTGRSMSVNPGYVRVKTSNGRATCRLHFVRETLPGGATYNTLDLGTSEEDDTPPVLVPPGHLFLLGDNRDDSADSRVPAAWGGLGGAVPIETIGGRAEFVTFSLNGNATWNPLTWPGDLRAGRFGRSLRPTRSQ